MDALDSFNLAIDFLNILSPDQGFLGLSRETTGTIPPAPKGFVLQERITFHSPFFATTATVPFACYSSDRILLCETLVRPDLVKPELIRALWLHLNIACLVAADAGLTPQALATCRLQPCIVGLKPAPHECVPLALAALRYAQQAERDLENLPF